MAKKAGRPTKKEAEKKRKEQQKYMDSEPHPEVMKLAKKIKKATCPLDIMKIHRSLAHCVMMRYIPEKDARAIGYILQNWQMSYKAAEAEANAIEADQNEVYVSVEVNGKQRQSQLDKVKKHKDLWAIVQEYGDKDSIH